MSAEEFVIVNHTDRRAITIAVRRELERVERLLEGSGPVIITDVGINLIMRQLHLLHASEDDCLRWIEGMAEAMKKGLRDANH